jgi:hypothetical protein
LKYLIAAVLSTIYSTHHISDITHTHTHDLGTREREVVLQVTASSALGGLKVERWREQDLKGLWKNCDVIHVGGGV